MWHLVAATAAPIVMGGITSALMNNKANDMQQDITTANNNLNNALDNRQNIYNAAEDIRALKSQLTNAYANLGVATQAAEIQMQQTDLALANMMEGMVQTGSGASATALATAAAKSKQGIAANIEQQEVANQKLYAQGEQAIQQQRIQLDQSAIAAEQQAWQAAEEREVFDINRLQAEADFLRNQQQAYQDAATAALMGGLSGATQVGSAYAGGLAGNQ